MQNNKKFNILKPKVLFALIATFAIIVGAIVGGAFLLERNLSKNRDGIPKNRDTWLNPTADDFRFDNDKKYGQVYLPRYTNWNDITDPSRPEQIRSEYAISQFRAASFFGVVTHRTTNRKPVNPDYFTSVSVRRTAFTVRFAYSLHPPSDSPGLSVHAPKEPTGRIIIKYEPPTWSDGTERLNNVALRGEDGAWHNTKHKEHGDMLNPSNSCGEPFCYWLRPYGGFQESVKEQFSNGTVDLQIKANVPYGGERWEYKQNSSHERQKLKATGVGAWNSEPVARLLVARSAKIIPGIFRERQQKGWENGSKPLIASWMLPTDWITTLYKGFDTTSNPDDDAFSIEFTPAGKTEWRRIKTFKNHELSQARPNDIHDTSRHHLYWMNTSVVPNQYPDGDFRFTWHGNTNIHLKTVRRGPRSNPGGGKEESPRIKVPGSTWSRIITWRRASRDVTIKAIHEKPSLRKDPDGRIYFQINDFDGWNRENNNRIQEYTIKWYIKKEDDTLVLTQTTSINATSVRDKSYLEPDKIISKILETPGFDIFDTDIKIVARITKVKISEPTDPTVTIPETTSSLKSSFNADLYFDKELDPNEPKYTTDPIDFSIHEGQNDLNLQPSITIMNRQESKPNKLPVKVNLPRFNHANIFQKQIGSVKYTINNKDGRKIAEGWTSDISSKFELTFDLDINNDIALKSSNLEVKFEQFKFKDKTDIHTFPDPTPNIKSNQLIEDRYDFADFVEPSLSFDSQSNIVNFNLTNNNNVAKKEQVKSFDVSVFDDETGNRLVEPTTISNENNGVWTNHQISLSDLNLPENKFHIKLRFEISNLKLWKWYGEVEYPNTSSRVIRSYLDITAPIVFSSFEIKKIGANGIEVGLYFNKSYKDVINTMNITLQKTNNKNPGVNEPDDTSWSNTTHSSQPLDKNKDHQFILFNSISNDDVGKWFRFKIEVKYTTPDTTGEQTLDIMSDDTNYGGQNGRIRFQHFNFIVNNDLIFNKGTNRFSTKINLGSGFNNKIIKQVRHELYTSTDNSDFGSSPVASEDMDNKADNNYDHTFSSYTPIDGNWYKLKTIVRYNLNGIDSGTHGQGEKSYWTDSQRILGSDYGVNVINEEWSINDKEHEVEYKINLNKNDIIVDRVDGTTDKAKIEMVLQKSENGGSTWTDQSNEIVNEEASNPDHEFKNTFAGLVNDTWYRIVVKIKIRPFYDDLTIEHISAAFEYKTSNT